MKNSAETDSAGVLKHQQISVKNKNKRIISISVRVILFVTAPTVALMPLLVLYGF